MPEGTDAPDTGGGNQPNKPAEPAEQPSTEAPDTGGEAKDWEAEAKKWQAQSRKHEKEWKKYSKELDDARQAQMSETEKAVADAEARGRAGAVKDVGQRLAAAEIKAALTGVVPDPSLLIEDLNLARYVADDGEVDAEAVAVLKAKFQGLNPQAKPDGDKAKPDPSQRPRESMGSVPLPGGDKIQLDESTDPAELAKRIPRRGIAM